ncbi:MAG: biotin/lipoyl-containing protein [Alphaproteobacteria bacterium]
MAVAVFCSLRDIDRAAQVTGQLPGRTPAIGARWIVTVAGRSVSVYVRKKDYGYDISYDDGLIVIRSGWKLGRKLFQGTVNGRAVSVKVRPLAEGYQLNYAGAEVKATLRSLRVAELAQYMPVRESTVSAFEGHGAHRRADLGDPRGGGRRDPHRAAAFVIEAMKMENIIYADNDATVKEVHVKAPASVSAGQLVIEYENTEEKKAA